MLDDEERSAVFDAAAGVLEFGFAQDVAAGFFGELLQPDQGCLADCCAFVRSRPWESWEVYIPSRKPRCPMP